MADLAFRSVGVGTGSGTSLTITAPAGIVENDLLVTNVGVVALGGTAPTITTLAGWTLIGTQTASISGGAYTARMSTFYKIAGASEPGTYVWTTGSSVSSSGKTLAYDNPLVSGAFDTYLSSDFTGTATPTASAITTAEANEMVVTMFFVDQSGATWTPPTGMTERNDSSSTAASDVLQASAGSSGTKQSTASASGAGIWFIMAFKSEAAAASILPMMNAQYYG